VCRIEQQMLFRQEWKVLTPAQRTAMLAGVSLSRSVCLSLSVRVCVGV
jgi:hypothetical protein